jgi:hypothetical protein
MKYKIEKGIKSPAAGGWKYPFKQMQPGDSFLIKEDAMEVARIRTAAYHYGRENKGIKFSIRKTDSGFRCWRLK